MKRVLLSGLLMLVCLASTAEVVYLKQSELFALATGQHAGTAAAQLTDIRQHNAHRQDRNTRLMCGTWAALGGTDPAAAAMKGLLGYGEICDRLAQASAMVQGEARNRSSKDAFVAQVKAGDLTAYSTMYRQTMSAFGHVPLDERLPLACPYLFAGARKGDPLAISFLAQECLLSSPVEGDRNEAFALLQACAERQHHFCAGTLAGNLETTRRQDYSWPVKADDREALRRYEELVRNFNKEQVEGRGSDKAAAHWRDEYRKSAERVRTRMAREAATAARLAAAASAAALFQQQESLRLAREAQEASAWADMKRRRCESLSRSAERSRQAAARDPARHGQYAAVAQERYEKACKEESRPAAS